MQDASIPKESSEKQHQRSNINSNTDSTSDDSANKSCVRENSVKSILRSRKTTREEPNPPRSRSKRRSSTTNRTDRSKSRDKSKDDDDKTKDRRSSDKQREPPKDRTRSQSRDKKKKATREEDNDLLSSQKSNSNDDERKSRGRSKSKIKTRERSKSSVRSESSDPSTTKSKGKEPKSPDKSRSKSRSKSRDSRKESSSDGNKKHVIRIKLGSKDASLEKLLSSSKGDSFRDTEKDILERLLMEHRLLMEEQQTLAVATELLTQSNLELADDLQKIQSDTRKVRLANQRIQEETHQLEDTVLPVYRDNVSNLESTLEQQSCTGSFENSLRSLYQEAVRKMCKQVRKRPDQVQLLSEKMNVLAANEMADNGEQDSEDDDDDLAASAFPFDDCDVHLWNGSDATGLTLDEDGVFVDDNSESGVFNDDDSDEDDTSILSKRTR